MKIDKVIFSSSEEYSCWWNIQSKIWKTFLNIDPVLLLYGSKDRHNLSEEYGEIIEVLDGIFQKFNFEVLYSHQETGNLVSFARDRKVANWCTQKGVKWIEVNASSVLRGGNADLRRVKLRQKDYRLQNPLPIPLDFSKPKQDNIFNRVSNERNYFRVQFIIF